MSLQLVTKGTTCIGWVCLSWLCDKCGTDSEAWCVEYGQTITAVPKNLVLKACFKSTLVQRPTVGM